MKSLIAISSLFFLIGCGGTSNSGGAGSSPVPTPSDEPVVSIVDASALTIGYARQKTVNLNISRDESAVAWCVSESQTEAPTSRDSSCAGGGGDVQGWYTHRPSEITLSDDDGVKQVYVWIADSSGTVLSKPGRAQIALDLTPPANVVVTLADRVTNSSEYTNQSLVNLGVLGDLDAVRWCVIQGAYGEPSPSLPSATSDCWKDIRPSSLLLESMGNRSVFVFTKDVAGNASASSGVAHIAYSDLPLPSIVLTDPVTGYSTNVQQTQVNVSITNDSTAVKWCLSESPNRPSSISACNGGNWLNSRPSLFNLSAGDGIKTVYLWYADLNNNISAAGKAQVNLDTALPMVISVSLTDLVSQSNLYTNESLVRLTIISGSDDSKWCVIEQSSQSMAPSRPIRGAGCWVSSKPTTLELGSTGVRKVYVFSQDAAGNVSLSAASAEIDYSITSPANPNLSLSDTITGQTTITHSTLVNVTISGDSGAVKWCISESNASPPSKGTSACSGSGWLSSRPETFTFSAGDGVKTAFLWISDKYGNVSSTSSAITLSFGPIISLGDATVNEWGVASIPVFLSDPVSTPVTLNFSTSDQSAQSGVEYLGLDNFQVTIEANKSNGFISVPLITSDAIASVKRFSIALNSVSSGFIMNANANIDIIDQFHGLGVAQSIDQIAAGNTHMCVKTSQSEAKCWGENLYGQLGDGTQAQSSTPVKVMGLNSDVEKVAAGIANSCVLLTSGAVKCWGSNAEGQLGDGSTTSKIIPTQVSGLTSGVSQVVAGGYHVCALLNSGAVQCWGSNTYGQLGDGSTLNRLTPTQVLGLTSGVVQISAGRSHTCALLNNGAVNCWGAGGYGQIGNLSFINKTSPTQVSGLTSGVSQISARGDHSCALLNTGAVKCWGYNSYGQLGDGTQDSKNTPTQVSGLTSGVNQITAGWLSSCALLGTGEVRCWGSNLSGQIGDGTITNWRLTPTKVIGLSSSVTHVSAANHFSCARLSSGSVQCWGRGKRGELGDGTVINKSTKPRPTQILDLSSNALSLAAGSNHTCALLDSGSLKCWGLNLSGQIGDGFQVDKYAPTQVTGLSSGVTSVVAGENHSCALLSDGSAKCWGQNTYGAIGDDSTIDRSLPTQVLGLTSGVSKISAGGRNTCVLLSSGAVKCWGDNSSGQIGNGDAELRSQKIPTQVSGLTSDVTQISMGYGHACALLSTGAVKCWGANGAGQLGDGSQNNKNAPIQVSGLTSGVIQIAAGNYQTCALLTTGAVKCWGVNGKLADGSLTFKTTPTEVTGLSSGVAEIKVGGSAGAIQACAILKSGAVKCWGDNVEGRLGDGTSIARYKPTQVSGLASGVSSLALGYGHSCVLLKMGGVQCWGENSYGQVGLQSIMPSFVRELLSPNARSSIFVTKMTVKGNVTWFNADAICSLDANMNGIAGHFKALISTSSMNARERLVINYPVNNVADGSVVESDDLWGSSLEGALKYADGNAASGSAFTGTGTSGSADTNYTCQDWMSSDANDLGTVGDISSIGPQVWFSSGSRAPCGLSHHLICVGQ